VSLLHSVSGITNCSTFIYRSDTASPPMQPHYMPSTFMTADRHVCTPRARHLMVSAVSCMTQTLYSQGRAPYPLTWRLGGPHGQPQRFGDNNNPLPLPRIEPRFLGCPACILVTIPTEGTVLPPNEKKEDQFSKQVIHPKQYPSYKLRAKSSLYSFRQILLRGKRQTG
jgi:hypothetical protein